MCSAGFATLVMYLGGPLKVGWLAQSLGSSAQDWIGSAWSQRTAAQVEKRKAPMLELVDAVNKLINADDGDAYANASKTGSFEASLDSFVQDKRPPVQTRQDVEVRAFFFARPLE